MSVTNSAGPATRATRRRLLQPWWVLVLAATFVTKLLAANVRVAWDVLTPRLLLRPAILCVPARPQLGDVGLALLANLISVTPGTLTLEVDPDRRVLFVHAMYPGWSRHDTLEDLDRLQLRLIAALYGLPPTTTAREEP